jgi:hypothetical protein
MGKSLYSKQEIKESYDNQKAFIKTIQINLT